MPLIWGFRTIRTIRNSTFMRMFAQLYLGLWLLVAKEWRQDVNWTYPRTSTSTIRFLDVSMYQVSWKRMKNIKIWPVHFHTKYLSFFTSESFSSHSLAFDIHRPPLENRGTTSFSSPVGSSERRVLPEGRTVGSWIRWYDFSDVPKHPRKKIYLTQLMMLSLRNLIFLFEKTCWFS